MDRYLVQVKKVLKGAGRCRRHPRRRRHPAAARSFAGIAALVDVAPVADREDFRPTGTRITDIGRLQMRLEFPRVVKRLVRRLPGNQANIYVQIP